MGSFLKSTTAITFAEVFGVGATAVNSFLLAYILGPAGIGTVSLLVLIPTLSVVLSSGGLHFAIVYYLNQKIYTVETILSSALWVGIATGVLLSLIGIVFMSQLAYAIPLATKEALLLAILSTLPQTLLLYFGEACIGLGYTAIAMLLRALPSSLYLLGSIFWVVLLGKGVTGAVLAFFTGTAVAVSISVILLFRRNLIHMKIDLGFIKEAFKFGLKVHIGDIAQYFIYRADVIIINQFSGAATVGFYSLACRISELIWIPSNTLRMAVLAKTSATSTDSTETAALISRIMIFFGLVFGICALILGSLFIAWVLPRYIPSILMLALLLPGAVAISVFRVLVGSVVGDGKSGKITRISLIALMCGLPLYVILISSFSSYGAAIASTLLYIGEYLAVIRLITFNNKIDVRNIVVINKCDFDRIREIVAGLLVKPFFTVPLRPNKRTK